MSLAGKNKKVFSYNNADKSQSNFMYKNLEKTNSYHSNFQRAIFIYATLRGAKMKYCNFSGASFVGSEFVGTNFRGSNFSGAYFKNAIFWCTILDKTEFENAIFEDCYFITTGISSARNFPADSTGITFFNSLPPIDSFSTELIHVVEEMRSNDIIRRSHTLHLKQGKINTLSLFILLKTFSEDDLIAKLPKLSSKVTSQFYTFSYLKKQLTEID